MKTRITNIAAALLLMAGTALNANTGDSPRSVEVSTENSKAVVIKLNNLTDGTEILLKDEAGRVLFQDEAEKAKYTKILNLNALEEGAQYLEIESDEQLKVLTIQVNDMEAYLQKPAEILIEKPILKAKGDMAKIFFGKNEGGTKVVLFNENQDVVYRGNCKGKSVLTYDLSNLAAGKYTFHFKTGDRTFYESITVK